MIKKLGTQRAYDQSLKGFRIMPDKLYFFGRSTVCPMLVLLYQMGYKEIILYGLDLSDKRYFWIDRSPDEVHWRWNRERLRNRNTELTGSEGKTIPHINKQASIIFIPYFNDNYMKGNIYVGSEKSALSKHLKYKTIEELK
jgi:hypothetical protein